MFILRSHVHNEGLPFILSLHHAVKEDVPTSRVAYKCREIQSETVLRLQMTLRLETCDVMHIVACAPEAS